MTEALRAWRTVTTPVWVVSCWSPRLPPTHPHGHSRPPSHSLQQAGRRLVFLAALMMAAPTHLKGGARNTKKFKCRNQDSESNVAGIIEGNLQVK